MEFEEVIRNRKSTRLFGSKKLEKEKLDLILEAGRLAPTAKNNQPIKIYVVQSEEGLKSIDKASICRYKASTVLIVCGDKEKSYQKNGMPIYVVDASIVGTHMMLEATNVGVDSIWIELFDEEVLRKEFDIPDNLVPVLMMPLGYKAKLCPPSPFHNKRKSIEDIVEMV